MTKYIITINEEVVKKKKDTEIFDYSLGRFYQCFENDIKKLKKEYGNTIEISQENGNIIKYN